MRSLLSPVVRMVPRPPGAIVPSLVTVSAMTISPELNNAPAWLMKMAGGAAADSSSENVAGDDAVVVDGVVGAEHAHRDNRGLGHALIDPKLKSVLSPVTAIMLMTPAMPAHGPPRTVPWLTT